MFIAMEAFFNVGKCLNNFWIYSSLPIFPKLSNIICWVTQLSSLKVFKSKLAFFVVNLKYEYKDMHQYFNGQATQFRISNT